MVMETLIIDQITGKLNKNDLIGYYTFDRLDMVTNFIKSKNVTYVHLADKIGTQKLANFFNLISGFDKRDDKKFMPYLSLVLGTMETSTSTFAQMLTVIANKGIYRPITTLEYVIEADGKKHSIDKLLEEKRVVSRESAESSFWLGYLNTFGGTAKRFISGGIGKTGSSKTDAGFAAMTGRTEKEYIEDNPEHILNSNLLYVVNVGVNEGEAPELYGGRVGAANANNVFNRLLSYEKKDNKGQIKKLKHKISGDILSTFSKNFSYQNKFVSGYGYCKIPIAKTKTIKYEEYKSTYVLNQIWDDFVDYKEQEFLKKYGYYPDRYTDNLPYFVEKEETTEEKKSSVFDDIKTQRALYFDNNEVISSSGFATLINKDISKKEN